MASIAGKMRSQSEHIKRLRETLNNKKIIGQKPRSHIIQDHNTPNGVQLSLPANG